LQGRDPMGMGGHQIGRPKPGGQRQLEGVHDRAGGYRGLSAAAGAFPGPPLGLQLPSFARRATGADKALGPARREQVSNARPPSAKRRWNAIKERRKSVTAAFRRAYVRYLF
jgi:hypothetical protein